MPIVDIIPQSTDVLDSILGGNVSAYQALNVACNSKRNLVIEADLTAFVPVQYYKHCSQSKDNHNVKSVHLFIV